jgi:hypothetical protein
VPELWLPGAAGPYDDFVARLHTLIERFAKDRELPRACVEIELRDGSRFTLESVAPEPGYGFITLTPQAGEEDAPEQLVVPIGAIARLELWRAEEERAQLGFTVPAERPRTKSG